MPSQALLKKIAALQSQKFRQKYGQFTVEGRKAVEELIHSRYKVLSILATEHYLTRNSLNHEHEIISEKEMSRISAYSTPPGILALSEIINFDKESPDPDASITLCLDGISDPGNLGTLIRTADWFGIQQIVLSEDCTDFYNPKTLSATMGSFTRCKFWYTDLAEFLKNKNAAGAYLDGVDVQKFRPQFPLLLLIGSESHGIRDEVGKQLKQKITIPGYGMAESLNAAVAAGIIMEHITRQLQK